MTQVFISYSRKDLAFVERLEGDLRAVGLEVWYDLSGLEIGAHWGMEIQAAIRQSQYIIIVLSPNSVASEWVEREFIYASSHNLKVIPLVHKTCDLPLWSVNMHYIDMQGRNYKRHFGELLKVLGVEAGQDGNPLEPAAQPLPERGLSKSKDSLDRSESKSCKSLPCLIPSIDRSSNGEPRLIGKARSFPPGSLSW